MKQTRTHRSLSALLVAGAMLAAGCSKDEPIPGFYATHPDAVRFGVTIGNAPDTRANTEGDGSTFLPADRIAISADGGTTRSVYELPATGDNWLPASGERYVKWTADALTFQAWYPVTDGTSYTTFTLPTDQSTLDGLRSADYMTATTTAQSSAPSVALAFEHQLVKLTVKVTKGEEAAGIELVRGEVFTKASKIENGQVIVNEGGALDILKPYKQSGDTYTVILPPQQANPDAQFIAIFNSLNIGFGLTGIPQLEKGKAYTLNLQAGHDGLKLAGITVEDWTPQGMDPGTALYKDPTIWDGKYPASTEEAKAWMGPESEGGTDADGRKHVFTITAARQLAALQYLMINRVEMANATSNTVYTNATYKLAADMDLNNHPWTPIGQRLNPMIFTGIFDGQGHTIREMNITGNYSRSGFFAIVGGVVKHLNVKGTVAPVFTSTEYEAYCGGIAGEVYSMSNACIAFCSFEGTVAATLDKPVYAGGIAGQVSNSYSGPGQILSCYSVVTSMTLGGTGLHAKGGIAGQMWNDASAIKGCYWQALTDITEAYGTKTGNGTVEGNTSFADAAGANAAVGAMNSATPTGYDYQWQAGTNGSYPVLVPKVP